MKPVVMKPAAVNASQERWDVEFRRELREKITPATLVSYLRAGLDAMETKFFSKDGEVVEQVDVIAWSERRQYAELVAKMMGFMNRVELSGPDGGPVPMAVVMKNLTDDELVFMKRVLTKAKEVA